MKSFLLKIITLFALSANLFADNSSANVSAVAVSSNTMSISGMEYGFGLGFDHEFKNSVVLGANGRFTYADLGAGADWNMINVLFEVNLGYRYKDFEAYAILPMLITSSEAINSTGFGYGVGLKYKVSKSFTLRTEYVSTSMSDIETDLDYDYSSISISVCYKY